MAEKLTERIKQIPQHGENVWQCLKKDSHNILEVFESKKCLSLKQGKCNRIYLRFALIFRPQQKWLK